MISIYAVFAITATLICTLLAIFVYFTNRRGALNKIFIFAIALGAYTAFSTFMVIQAESAQTAYFWNKVGFLWPFFSVALLDFVLTFSSNRLSTSPKKYLYLYLPAAVFSILDLTTDLLSGNVVDTAFGYKFAGSDSPVAFASSLWSAAISITSIALCLRYYHKIADANKKQQAKLVTLSLFYPISANLLSMGASIIFGWYIPYYGVGANSILCVFIVYAIWKYDLFNLNPAIAAENIIETMPDAFVLTDLQGTIIRINPSLTNLLGYSENEIIRKPLHQLFGQKQEKLFQDIVHKQELRNQETEFTTKAGGKKPVAISSSLIKGRHGRNIGITIIVHDLTRRKQDEAKILKSERFAAIGELAGMVGHDLRNPLNSIQVATYYIKKKSVNKLDSTSQEMLNTIQASIQYSNKIINDLLDYSRELTLEMEETSPTRLTQNALLMVEVPSNIQVVNLTEDSPTLRVDNVKMNRVMVNIIKNGFEAMPNGGKLTIRSAQKENNLQLSVEDTGVGMTNEVLEKLWKPLFTTKAKGMGFGLAICKRIVEAHGGRIMVSSSPGMGTTFTLALPLSRLEMPHGATNSNKLLRRFRT